MHTLLHIYGPFAIHGYGLAIAVGLLIFIYLIKKDPRFATLKLEHTFNAILIVGTLSAFLGGRLLFLLNQPEQFESMIDVIAFWQPGFSILGSILGVLCIMPLYLHMLHVPIVGLLDLLAIYAPLLQSISRIGCYLAGCCYGLPTTQPWGIIYTETGSAAPLHVCIHPTQLYSALLLMIIFALMYFVLQHICKKPLQLMAAYVFFTGFERFMVDFWRGDRIEMNSWYAALSSYQYLALGMMAGATLIFAWTLIPKKL